MVFLQTRLLNPSVTCEHWITIGFVFFPALGYFKRDMDDFKLVKILNFWTQESSNISSRMYVNKAIGAIPCLFLQVPQMLTYVKVE